MPAVVFAMNTGLRGGELGRMDRSDINFEARMLTVRRESDNYGKQRAGRSQANNGSLEVPVAESPHLSGTQASHHTAPYCPQYRRVI